MFQSVSGHNSEKSIAHHSSRPTVLQDRVSSVIYYWTDARQNGIYLLNILPMLSSFHPEVEYRRNCIGLWWSSNLNGWSSNSPNSRNPIELRKLSADGLVSEAVWHVKFNMWHTSGVLFSEGWWKMANITSLLARWTSKNVCVKATWLFAILLLVNFHLDRRLYQVFDANAILCV